MFDMIDCDLTCKLFCLTPSLKPQAYWPFSQLLKLMYRLIEVVKDRCGLSALGLVVGIW
jgi:hypothetical protein